MAYTSNESGRNEIYVRPFPEVDKGKWQVSTSGGSTPRWSPNGRELFYLSTENSVMAVDGENAADLQPWSTQNPFQEYLCPAILHTSGTPWDISPDGKRFLMMKEPGSCRIRRWRPAQNQHRPELV